MHIKPSVDQVNNLGDLFTAGIDVDDWMQRIQCHGETLEQAKELRDKVFIALCAYASPQMAPIPDQLVRV